MKITSSAVVDGALDIIYGKFGDDVINGMPVRSFPFEIHEAPHDTVSFAFIFDDPDSIPVCGFPWTHWMAANLHDTVIADDASRTNRTFIQGVNSWFNPRRKETALQYACYGGPAPPDRTYTYVLTLWALDSDVAMQQGFSKQELLNAIKGHIVATAKLHATYQS